MWPTVTAHRSYSYLFYKSFARVRLNLPLVFSTIRGRRQLPGNDCRAHNSFMFHFPSKLSSSVWQMNFQVAETLQQQQQQQQQSAALGDTSAHVSYSCWLLVSFPDKTKTNKHSVRQEQKQPAGEERHKHTEGRRDRDKLFVFCFLFLFCLKMRMLPGSGSMAKNGLITFIDLLFTHGWQNRQDS